MTVAKTYICKNKCKPEVITQPLTFIPKCSKCKELMIEGQDE